MSTFHRIAAVAILICSFAFFASALPSPRVNKSSWDIVGADRFELCAILAIYFSKAKDCIDSIAQCNDLVTLKARIAIFVALCNTCAIELLKISAEVKISAEAQASIVTCFVSLLTLLVKVFVALTLKFSITVVVALCGEVDVVVHLLLKSLEVCIKGVVALIVKACAGSVIDGFLMLSFKHCLNVFGA
ncbi:hypothetical protein RSOLAG22IIIB_08072 [Rhizoctonia solani]|uniref:Transmembrane protein n=1 Tax=Rhizoctonia solani TaxID=456999 RepID=A0A0K6FR02_9AGAM|nr:hypothetical protein RSOLAG22IIIB_08072 [Rhizoctonia solani]